MNRIRSTLRMMWDAASISLRVWPFGSVVLLSSCVLVALVQPLSALALGRVVDALTHSAGTAPWFGVYVVSTVGLGLIVPWRAYVYDKTGELVQHEVNRRLMEASLRAPGLEHLESPEYADRLQTVRSRPEAFVGVNMTFTGMVFHVVSLGVTLIALASVSPLVAVIPLLAIASMALQGKRSMYQWRYRDKAAAVQRRAAVFQWAGTDAQPAKEVRAFGLSRHIVTEFRRLQRELVRLDQRRRLIADGIDAAHRVTKAAGFAAGIWLLVWEATRGRASAGQVAMGIIMLRQVMGNSMDIGMSAANIVYFRGLADRFRWLMSYRSPLPVSDTPEPVEASLRDGITLDNVSFTYPGTDREVLSGVSMSLPAGSTIALVGLNGAGKTTLIKLVSRFYDPTHGRILVDGVDLRDIDVHAWRGAMSGAFQDFAQFKFLVRETIGVGDVDSLDDMARIRAAAEAGGGAAVADWLPSGYETQLGTEFPNGTELSEGHWQRLALSRGAMRTTPLLQVLDEPTASLDARNEHELFERVSELAEDARRRGGITLLVSHRFSTVRMATLILVIDNGRLVESGSHAELMAADGQYAQLYRLQASAYT